MAQAEQDFYVAVGSNVAPERHLPDALRALEKAYAPFHCSSVYRSLPIGFEGPNFFNCAVRGRTTSTPEELTAQLKSLERQAGRRRLRTNASRELDLDLVLYGDEVIERESLVLPREDVLKYPFVLRPLVDLAPDLVHPLTGKTLSWHWRHFAGVSVSLEPVQLSASHEE